MFFVYQHHLHFDSVVIVEGRTEQAADNRALENGIDFVSTCEACGDTFWCKYNYGGHRFNTVNEALLEVHPRKFEVIYIKEQ
jgi:hypothetical protein